MTDYISRIVDAELDELSALPAVAIDGAKGVGKTETALRRAESVFRLDDPADREILSADPARIETADRPVLIDEWQRMPPIWDRVRRAVDAGSEPGRFLLTGSAAPLEAPTHSGAGRIVSVRMRPLALCERGIDQPTVSLGTMLSASEPIIEGETAVRLDGYVSEIVSSGFPGIRPQPPRARRALLDGYVDRIVERDFSEQGNKIRNAPALRRWMSAYGAATSTTTSYDRIRDAATSGTGDKSAKSTTAPYRNVLEQLWILDPLPGWVASRNPLSRLVARSKHHLVDPALAARLIGVDEKALIDSSSTEPTMSRDGSLLGHLFESLITLSVRVMAQASEARVSHLRTRGGEHEVDLIVERRDSRVVAVEVKLSATIDDRDTRHLRWLRSKIGDDLIDAVVITTGRFAYRRPDGIAVVPAALLGP